MIYIFYQNVMSTNLSMTKVTLSKKHEDIRSAHAPPLFEFVRLLIHTNGLESARESEPGVNNVYHSLCGIYQESRL